MARFVRAESEDGVSILLNLDQVLWLEQDPESKAQTFVYMPMSDEAGNPHAIVVKGTPAEVLRLPQALG